MQIHGAHKVTPVMAAVVSKTLWEMSDKVAMLEEFEAQAD